MASILDKPAIRQVVLPITVEQYHRLGSAGIIPQNTELLRGVIVEKMVKSPLHSWVVQLLSDWLRSGVGAGFCVRQEQPLTLADSEPEPDLAVVEGGPDDYRSIHPTTGRLVIEVAIASVEVDREKAALYAAAGVPEFWLVLPDQRAVEVYTGPSASGYTQSRRCVEHDVISPASLPGVKLDLKRLFA
jgi:Uma2 family endonuclease